MDDPKGSRAHANVGSVFTFSEAEFQELLGDESFVDIDRLREAARYGVPASVRGAVWKVLLGVSKPDKSEEMSTRKRMQANYMTLTKQKDEHHLDSDIIQRVRTDIRRIVNRIVSLNNSDMHNFEEIVMVYLSNHSGVNYHSALVSLLMPLVCVLDDTVDVYNCYTQLLILLGNNPMLLRIDKTMSTFLALFRYFDADLFAHFEDEEVSPNEWALGWIREVLVGCLPRDCLLRLWDTYLSTDLGWSLHIYVCLAMLRNNAEDLLELGRSELLHYLHSMPAADMDQIVTQAFNARSQVVASNLF